MGMHFSASYKIDTEHLKALVGEFSFMSYRLLSWMSYEAKQIFLREFVSGQELNYTKAGKSRTRYAAVKNRKNIFRVTSVPMNLFERGRKKPGGGKHPGKYVLTKKLPERTRAQTGKIIEQFKTEVLTQYVD